MKQYAITLADGTKLTGLGLNGTIFVSPEKVDETIFKDNLSVMTVTVSDGEVETETVYYNIVFIKQQKWPDGYYLAFYQKSKQELAKEAMDKAITDNTNSVAVVEDAVCELDESTEARIGTLEDAVCELDSIINGGGNNG